MTAAEYKAWRERMGWSQEEAAQILGLSRSGIQKRERGAAPISPEAEFAARWLEAQRREG